MGLPWICRELPALWGITDADAKEARGTADVHVAWVYSAHPSASLSHWTSLKNTGSHCWWEYKLVQPLWRTVWRFLKKLKIELPGASLVAVVKNPPANAGDTGSIPGPGRSHMLRSN